MREERMPPMPYVMEIGQVFSFLNDYLEDPARMKQMLIDLRDDTVTRVSMMDFFKNGNWPANAPGAAVASHIETDWFGWDPITGVQDPFVPNHPVPTGWWTRWYGTADTITRETLKRALEVALGVPHDGATEFTPQRSWRVMVNWTCGAPMYQGWVAWQWDEDDPQEGFVLVTFTTPGNGSALNATPHRPGWPKAPSSPPGPPDYEDAATTVGNYGMWVIGDHCTDVLRPPATTWYPLGTGVLPNWPNAFVYTHPPVNVTHPEWYVGDVAVVATAEVDGGVLQAGEHWA
jgi:hypothetical protein